MLDFPLVDHEAVQDQCMYLKNRVLVKEVIKKDPNMKAVFSGHQHAPRILEEDGITHYIVGSSTTSPEADGTPIGVYRIIETVNEDIITTEHHIVLRC